MESKYKRVNNMGRMSLIDERNRKFTKIVNSLENIKAKELEKLPTKK